MKYVAEYRDRAAAEAIAARLPSIAARQVSLMEVCGTHTVSIFRHGLRDLLPPNVRLISGPGCPVCVTTNADIDKSIALAERPDVTLVTFGDMMKVPGSYRSLAQVKAAGGDIRVVYSPRDSLRIASENPERSVVFLGVGFETTTPACAATVLEAEKLGIANFSALSFHKIVPPAMEALLSAKEVGIDGFICPGHVSAIIGEAPYRPIAERFGVPCVITGFEPVDVLRGIEMLLRQVAEGRAAVENAYGRAVYSDGNPVAREVAGRVFEVKDAGWRGLGTMPASGLGFREAYARFDAERVHDVVTPPTREHAGCRCGEVLRGVMDPPECPLFRKVCAPENPIGPCMVSSEGTCSAWYQFSE